MCYDSTWKDKVSSVNGKAMTYDLIGNLLTYDGKTHTWIAGRKLETFQNADYSLSFTYDENGLRSCKTVNHNGTSKTIKYIWVDGKLIGQMDDTDTLRFIYDDSEDIVGFIKNDSEIYLYIKNIFGDVIGIVDENGSVVVEYEYDVWGKLISVSGSLAQTLGKINPIRYRGYYYDSESGYYYLQSRYYDPELRRFINADKLESLYSPKNTYLYADSVNTFAYCANSPVNMVDYSGEKEADNIGVKIANAFTFLFVVESYKKAFTISTNTKYKKGALAIKIKKIVKKVKFSDLIYSYYETIGDMVFDIMAVYATDYFHQNYKKVHNNSHKKKGDKTPKRPFLFSDECVSFEIKHHVLGYWYADNKISEHTPVTYAMYKASDKDKTKMKDSCGTIDIAERHAYYVRDNIIFNYFFGIRNCYLFTLADPYWTLEPYERKPTLVRLDWIYSRLATYML